MRYSAKNTAATILLVVLWSALNGVPAAAQGTAEGPSEEEAAALFDAQDWESAAKAYEALVQRDPSNGPAWFRLGVSLQALQRHAEAAAAFEQADKTGGTAPVPVRLRAAIAYANLNAKDKALAWLERALATGFNVKLLNQFAGLESLREDERYQQLVAQYRNPCAQSAYRVFDFWVGEWDVESQGRHVGTNRIEKILDGCALQENWAGDSGGTGKSFNFYHAGTGKWKQTWVDDGGRVLEVEGEFRDGAMRFEGEVYLKDGTKVLDRMTFFPLEDDRVRQLIEHSTDNGKTWYVWFDGTYSRQ